MSARLRGALLATPLLLLVACGGGSASSGVNPTANDPKPGGGVSSTDLAAWDPTTGNIPLPNVLATAAATATLVPTAHVPFTPPQALVWLNQQEAGNTNAVSGINAPIYIPFTGIVDSATVNASTVKIYRVLPDASGAETNALGFQDVSAQFTYQVLPFVSGVSAGSEIYLMPKIPMLPASRYLYVVTPGVKDQATGLGVGRTIPFGFTLSQTSLVDSNGHSTTILSDAQAQQLEQVRANVPGPGGSVAFSGYAKVGADLVASASADASGKGASGAGPTGISSLDQIAVMGRTITNATGFTLPNPAGAPTIRMPVETLLYAWANNANVGATDFSNANARQWNNGVSNFQVIGSAAAPATLTAIFGTIPHSNVGTVSRGSFESGDLQMDPATVLANLAVAGGKEDGNNAYYPGTSTAPGTGTLMAFRSGTGQLFGYYHQSRTVPYILVTPVTAAPAGGYPVVIFEHGIGGSKEQALGMADTAAKAGYATIAIDQAVHGFAANGTTDDAGATITTSLTPAGVPGMGNNRPSAEWASNFFMLPSSLTARANIYTSAFHLWRLERILNEPAIDPASLTAQLTAAIGAGINTGPTTHKFVGQSLGSIVGTVFLAGNAGSTGGSNMPGFLSVPGARLGFVLHDSPAFQSAVNAGLAANGVPTGSPAYNQFFVVAQSIADSADPATLLTPLPGATSSRLAGRVAMQEAIGDLVIPNAEGNYWANALGGRKPQLGGDTSYNGSTFFSQILNDGDAAVALPFMFGGNPGDYTTIKAAVAAAIPTVSSTPTQGVFQFGTAAAPAAHGLLLQDTNTPVNVVRAQAQMYYWLLTGTIADGHTLSGQIAPPQPLPGELFAPENLKLYFPKAQ